jgi:lipid II:glycine glycyltransferase (peptidoglycan interpeptide bridge formation enzyme)
MSVTLIQSETKLIKTKETEFEVIYSTEDSKYNFYENLITPSYPMQTWSWAADFWLLEKQSVAGHAAYCISVADSQNPGVWIQAIVYQYPWHLKEVFLTIPRGPICSFNFHSQSNESQSKLLQRFKKELDELVTSTSAAFVKIESTWDGSQELDLTTGETDHDIAPLNYKLGQDLHKLFKSQKTNFRTKFLQPPYSRTIKIQASSKLDIKADNEDFNSFFDQHFETVVSKFESKTRYNARLAKKKGLQVFWDKNETAFEDFWQIMEKTSDRQEFVPYSRSYYSKVLKNDWADLVLVKTAEGEITNAWMGSFVAGMGMYLYGGSDLRFSALKGAELIHAAAIVRTLQKCGKVVKNSEGEMVLELIYDMGGSSLLDGALPGWDGYSKFKKGFGGKIVEYLPHTYDVIYKPWKYNWIGFLINTVKPLVKKLKGKH